MAYFRHYLKIIPEGYKESIIANKLFSDDTFSIINGSSSYNSWYNCVNRSSNGFEWILDNTTFLKTYSDYYGELRKKSKIKGKYIFDQVQTGTYEQYVFDPNGDYIWDPRISQYVPVDGILQDQSGNYIYEDVNGSYCNIGDSTYITLSERCNENPVFADDSCGCLSSVSYVEDVNGLFCKDYYGNYVYSGLGECSFENDYNPSECSFSPDPYGAYYYDGYSYIYGDGSLMCYDYDLGTFVDCPRYTISCTKYTRIPIYRYPYYGLYGERANLVTYPIYTETSKINVFPQYSVNYFKEIDPNWLAKNPYDFNTNVDEVSVNPRTTSVPRKLVPGIVSCELVSFNVSSANYYNNNYLSAFDTTSDVVLKELNRFSGIRPELYTSFSQYYFAQDGKIPLIIGKSDLTGCLIHENQLLPTSINRKIEASGMSVSSSSINTNIDYKLYYNNIRQPINYVGSASGKYVIKNWNTSLKEHEIILSSLTENHFINFDLSTVHIQTKIDMPTNVVSTTAPHYNTFYIQYPVSQENFSEPFIVNLTNSYIDANYTLISDGRSNIVKQNIVNDLTYTQYDEPIPGPTQVTTYSSQFFKDYFSNCVAVIYPKGEIRIYRKTPQNDFSCIENNSLKSFRNCYSFEGNSNDNIYYDLVPTSEGFATIYRNGLRNNIPYGDVNSQIDFNALQWYGYRFPVSYFGDKEPILSDAKIVPFYDQSGTIFASDFNYLDDGYDYEICIYEAIWNSTNKRYEPNIIVPWTIMTRQSNFGSNYGSGEIFSYHYSSSSKYSVKNLLYVLKKHPRISPGTVSEVTEGIAHSTFIPDESPYLPSPIYISKHTPNELELVPGFDQAKNVSIQGFIHNNYKINPERKVSLYGTSSITSTGILNQNLSVTFTGDCFLYPTDFNKVKFAKEAGWPGHGVGLLTSTVAIDNSFYIYILDDTGNCLNQHTGLWEKGFGHYKCFRNLIFGEMTLINTTNLFNFDFVSYKKLTRTISIPSTNTKNITCYLIAGTYMASTENFLKYCETMEIQKLVIDAPT